MHGVFFGLLFLILAAPGAANADDAESAPRANGGVAVASAERAGVPLRIALEMRAAQLAKVELSCSILSANPPEPVGVRPALAGGEAKPLAAVQFATGGQAAVTGAYATGIWQAAQDGPLTFSMETMGRGELTGCTLVGYRL